MKIGIIVGSTRPGRLGTAVGAWVLEQAEKHGGADYELVEVADLALTSNYEQRTDRAYEEPTTQRWSELVDGFDGFVFVTPEYNHGLPAPMKNAVDLLMPEWSGKAVAFVGYGGVGGARAVEQWRAVVANLSLVGVRQALHLTLADDFDGDKVEPLPKRYDEVGSVLDQLLDLTERLRR